ncbi:MAG: hypothetical protein PHR51_00455 [Patescibacteria group bacterium]|nr:hypothetical protein [Patescibacteria group bacterium]
MSFGESHSQSEGGSNTPEIDSGGEVWEPNGEKVRPEVTPPKDRLIEDRASDPQKIQEARREILGEIDEQGESARATQIQGDGAEQAIAELLSDRPEGTMRQAIASNTQKRYTEELFSGARRAVNLYKKFRDERILNALNIKVIEIAGEPCYVRYVPGREIYPTMGVSEPGNIAFVNDDLPELVKRSVTGHELFHCRDKRSKPGSIMNEIRAKVHDLITDPVALMAQEAYALINLKMTISNIVANFKENWE